MRRVSLWLTGLILAAMMVGCSQSPSQNGTVTGTVLGDGGPSVTAADRPQPLKQVKVTLIAVSSGTRYQTITRDKGTFTISVPPGTYILDSACGRAEPDTVRVTAGTRVKRTINCHFG
jgi:hypothetical protein